MLGQPLHAISALACLCVSACGCCKTAVQFFHILIVCHVYSLEVPELDAVVRTDPTEIIVRMRRENVLWFEATLSSDSRQTGDSTASLDVLPGLSRL